MKITFKFIAFIMMFQPLIAYSNSITTNNLLSIEGNPYQYTLHTTINDSRVELFFTHDPAQILLHFMDVPDFTLIDNQAHFLEMQAPLSKKDDILYILDHWQCTFFSVAYDPAKSNKIVNFNLHGVQKAPCPPQKLSFINK